MVDRESRLAIVASLAWVVLAAFAILGTHADVLAQLGTSEVRPEAAVEREAMLAPPTEDRARGEC